MNWAQALPALAFLGDLLLLILVVKGAWRSPAGRNLAFYVLALAGFSFSSWMMHSQVWPAPVFWFRLALTCVLLQIPFVIGFAALFPRPRPERQRGLIACTCYLLTAILLILIALGYLARDATPAAGQEGVVELEFGPAAAPFYLLMTLAMSYVAALYVISYRTTASESERRALRYPLAGLVLLFSGGFSNISSSLSRYPFDHLFYLGYAVLLSYAILRHRMLNISTALRRGAVYSALTILISLSYLVVALVSSHTLSGRLPGGLDLAGILVLALLVSVAYEPLTSRLRRAVDKIFFKEGYEYGATLEDLSRRISTLLDLDELAEATVRIIVDTVRLDMAVLFLRQEPGGEFQLLTAPSPSDTPPNIPEQIEPEASIAHCLIEEKGPLLLEKGDAGGASALVDAGFQLGLPMFAQKELIGFALLGPKLSRDPYFEEDLTLLATFANQIGTALENARLFRELQALEREHRNLIESMNDGYIVVRRRNNDFTILFANHRFARMLGYSVEEMIGGLVSKFIAAESMTKILDYSDARKRGEPFPSQTIGIALKKDGSTVRLEGSTRITEHEGEPAATIVLRDVTEREQFQEQLLRSQKLSALGQMAGGVAHDLNNALAVVLGRADLCQILLERPEVQLDKIRQHMQVLVQGVEDGAETVRRLQRFAGAGREAFERAFDSVELNQAVEDTIDLTSPRWQNQAQARGITFRILTELADMPPVRGNPSALRDVLTNLIFNALDAMPGGGVLTFKTWVEEDEACLSVSDSGTGMTDEVRRRCFDPFFTTKGPGSSGLGLSICYSIIREHGGMISVRSRPGAGATFLIRLPLAEVQVEAAARVEALPLTPLRALLVDDEQGVREAVAGLLELAGHQVETATDGEEALAIMEKQPFDVLITDLGMPGLNGWDVAKEAKQRWPDLPVLLLTGWGEKLEGKGQRYIDGIASKPVKLTDLQKALHGVLDGKQDGRAMSKAAARVRRR